MFLIYRCKDWVQRLRRDDLMKKDVKLLYSSGGYHLCSDHFENSQFMNANEKKRLIWSAVPSIFNIPNPPPTVTPKRRQPTKRSVTSEQHQSASKKSKVSGMYCATILFYKWIEYSCYRLNQFTFCCSCTVLCNCVLLVFSLYSVHVWVCMIKCIQWN